MKAVIQAGGKGTRLQPYTLVLPKPLMPVGGMPVLETLLRWLRRNGVTETFITTGYLGELIEAFCGDGSRWDMAIHYSREPEPLGTVGAITLLEDRLDDSFLMLNGDLITDLDLHKFTESHGSSGREITVATTKRKVDVDLGVIDSETGLLTGFREKPSFDFQVSMGIYCMNPTIFDIVPKGLPFGFDDLMYAMLKADRPVNVYDHQGLWMDVGREEDFRAAQLKFEEFADTLLAT